MSMTEEDWLNLGSVYRAGADQAYDGDALAAMADRCEHLGGARPFMVIDSYALAGGRGSDGRPYSYHRSQEEADEAVTCLADGPSRWRVKRSPGRSVR